MAYCPNPSCRHRKRTGKPAEFKEGIERCTDCGTGLVQENPEPPKARAPCPAPLKRRLVFTAGIVALTWISLFVPPAHIDGQAFEDLLGEYAPPAASYAGPFALGIFPFISAFGLIELFALAWPSLRRRRLEDPGLRRKLYTASLVTGVVLCMVQALGIAYYLESLGWSRTFGRMEVVQYPGWAFRIKFMLTLTAGSCLYVAAAQLINRFGVGSGFAIVLLAGWALALVENGVHTFYNLAADIITPLDLMLGVVVLIGICAGTWWFLSLSNRHDDKLVGQPLRLPTCGTLPIELATVLLMLPATLAPFFWVKWLSDLVAWLTPNKYPYLAIQLLMIVIFVPLASRWFYWRRRKKLTGPENRPAWRRAQFHSALFLLSVVLTWFALYRLLPHMGWFFPVSLAILPAVAMLIDLWQELKARWNAPGGKDLAPLASYQDVPDSIEAHRAVPAKHSAHLQGVHFRSLAYFFGPFIPLVILGVPADELDRGS